MKLLILTLFLLSGCAKKHKALDVSPDDDIKSKARLYVSLQPSALDSHGYAHDKCDSVGFTALCKYSGGCVEADISASEGERGRWYRSPEHDCYDTGGSKSDISKDMITMLLFWMSKDDAKATFDYAARNGFVMGRGELSRTIMTPSLAALVAKLGGVSWLPVAKEQAKLIGFETHLDVLRALLDEKASGGISDGQLSMLKDLASKQPRNALFQAAAHRFTDGDMSTVKSILMNPQLFPSDRLPAASDRCEFYLWQRDDVPEDWGPCDKAGKVFDGVDFLFAAKVSGLLD